MKLKTKIVDSMVFPIHCNTYRNRHQVFLKIHLKQSVRKLSDINFNYTERLHFALISEFSLTKI